MIDNTDFLWWPDTIRFNDHIFSNHQNLNRTLYHLISTPHAHNDIFAWMGYASILEERFPMKRVLQFDCQTISISVDVNSSSYPTGGSCCRNQLVIWAGNEYVYLSTVSCPIAAVFNWRDMSPSGDISDFGGGHNTICCHEKKSKHFAIQQCDSSGILVQSKFVCSYFSFRLYTIY